MLKIVNTPNKILNQPVRPVKKIDEKIKKLVIEMEEVLVIQEDPQGVGLAAPQVGVDLAIFIIKPTLKSRTEVFINPKILKLTTSHQTPVTKHKESRLEGCLSIPLFWGPVNRAELVMLEYEDLTGKKIQHLFKGFKATIIQHEMDHLNGILFTQRSIEQNQPLYEEKDGDLVKTKI